MVRAGVSQYPVGKSRYEDPEDKASMTTKPSKTPAPRKRASTSPAARTAIGRVPSPEELPPRTGAQPGTEATAPDTAPDTGPEMKKQELIEKVVLRSGVRKKDAKPVVEAMLGVLGETLADGRGLNLQPLGKLKLNRTKETPKARVIIAKLRQRKTGKKPEPTGNQTVAAAAE